ncbi:DUF2442 domain-containing protein [Dyadobacter frigoris]|uniref:DUF2442 domain-containing protein n=1 Tax=Dyadobacter frigoris TaxID=2576211 RepID=A0A4U6D3N3_9BACT|nr:DUF2442 domain-containing protein [Dyadobacter frigoris]TKT88524.1 DUF2442 domain-containing protein [Dyadobacter frigoris]GLU54571.1 hypothetical protein Dfri01_40320 [Dyadobacter frigoris]
MKFFDYKAEKVEVSEVEIRVTLVDGREAALLISDFPLLKEATSSQRKNVEVINGYALYWPELGEDLSVAGFFEKEMISNNHK